MRTQWPNETMVTNEVDVKNLDEKDILLRILDRMDKAVSNCRRRGGLKCLSRESVEILQM